MKINLVALAAVLALSVACSKQPETPTSATPTPAPSASVAPTVAAATPTPAPTPRAIYVAGIVNESVFAFDPSGASADGFTVPMHIKDVWGLAFNPANNTLYVTISDEKVGTIRTFDATTGAETQIGFANAAGLSEPSGLAVAGGKLFVANTKGKNVLVFDAATGAPVTGFATPEELSRPSEVAVAGNVLYVSDFHDGKVYALDVATGVPVPGFTTVTSGVNYGLAASRSLLFVSSQRTNTVAEYDAVTGAVINANFITGLHKARGLALLGDTLLVADEDGNVIGKYGVPDVPTAGNVPTSSNPSFITKPKSLNGDFFPDVVAVAP